MRERLDGGSMSRSRIPFVLGLLILLGDVVPAQEETISMAVLSSHRHRIGASDNPLVGLFVSTDRGATWRHRGWKEYIRTFSSVRGRDGTLWSACGNGILRSLDGGETWRVTTGWDVTEVLKVNVNDADPRRVAAATAYGVVTTTDGGETWRTSSTGKNRRFCSDVTWVRGSASGLLAGTEKGIVRSTDGGATWRPSGLRTSGVRVIVNDPGDRRVYWAGTEDDGVHRSTDAGMTWRRCSAGLLHTTVYALAIHPGNPNIAYAGTHGGGVYKTTDGGRSWRQCARGLANLDVHAVIVLPSDPSVVFAGTLNGGLYVSNDGAETWNFNSQEDAQVWGLSVSEGATRAHREH